MLKTRFTEMFGLSYPVMSAPMALHSGGSLAAAVSGAGGLGSFGGMHPTKGPDWIRSEIKTVRAGRTGPLLSGSSQTSFHSSSLFSRRCSSRNRRPLRFLSEIPDLGSAGVLKPEVG